MAYCTPNDLLLKDVLLKPGQTTEVWVDRAAEEMDSFLGDRYIVPIAPAPAYSAISAQDERILKQINLKLASGRILLAQAMNDERDRLHAYGRSLVNEAINALTGIRDGRFDLLSLELVPGQTDDSVRMPGIINKDKGSLLDAWEQEVMGL